MSEDEARQRAHDLFYRERDARRAALLGVVWETRATRRAICALNVGDYTPQPGPTPRGTLRVPRVGFTRPQGGVRKVRSGRFIASVSFGYQRTHLGTFDTPEEAREARDAALEAAATETLLTWPAAYLHAWLSLHPWGHRADAPLVTRPVYGRRILPSPDARDLEGERMTPGALNREAERDLGAPYHRLVGVTAFHPKSLTYRGGRR